MKVNYKPHRFAAPSLELIASCNVIIEDYAAQGYSLTLRQLYYRLVAANIVKNTEESYDRVGVMLNKARLSGLVTWDAITDRTRNMYAIPHFTNPAQVVRSAYDSFRIDKWHDQPTRVEVWVEKEALVDVAARAANRNDVGYLACRGYMSQSEMHESAMRYVRYMKAGQRTVIIHLGDHDPSGIDMSRDNADRLAMFMNHHIPESAAFLDRIALNMAQIEQYEPPPNPAKESDCRFRGYSDIYGEQSWELDALEPRVLDALIDEAIKQNRDDDRYVENLKREVKGRAQLSVLSAQFANAVDALSPTQIKKAEANELRIAAEYEDDLELGDYDEDPEDSTEEIVTSKIELYEHPSEKYSYWLTDDGHKVYELDSTPWADSTVEELARPGEYFYDMSTDIWRLASIDEYGNIEFVVVRSPLSKPTDQ